MRLAFFVLPAGLLLCGACSSKDASPTPDPCIAFEHGEGSCPTMCGITNGEFCATSGETPNCSALPPGGVLDACGVPLQPPPKKDNAIAPMTRSANVDEYFGTGPVDLACFSPAGYPPPANPAASKLVTMKGVAKIFSHGCESKNVMISVHKVKRTGGADEADIGDAVGTPVTTDADCTIAGVPEPNDDCGTRYECTYSYAEVPTETELMVITEGPSWSNLYDYGVFISNAEAPNDEYAHDVRALDQSDYNSIAQVALGSTLTPGKGALAGEVHDCGDVRVVNAIVDVNVPRAVLTYFTDNEAHPLPSLDAKGTSTLGLYAAMDVAPGPIAVAAAGIKDGQLQGVGFFRARIFADSVTTFTFRGLRPFQVP